mgnify:CR=1 FL=1
MTEEINNKSIGADLQNAPKATDNKLKDEKALSHLNEYGTNTTLQFSEEIDNTVLTDDQGNIVKDEKGEDKKAFGRFSLKSLGKASENFLGHQAGVMKLMAQGFVQKIMYVFTLSSNAKRGVGDSTYKMHGKQYKASMQTLEDAGIKVNLKSQIEEFALSQLTIPMPTMQGNLERYFDFVALNNGTKGKRKKSICFSGFNTWYAGEIITEDDVKLTNGDVWKQKDVQDVFNPRLTEEEAFKALKKCRDKLDDIKKNYKLTLATAMWDTKPVKLDEEQVEE